MALSTKHLTSYLSMPPAANSTVGRALRPSFTPLRQPSPLKCRRSVGMLRVRAVAAPPTSPSTNGSGNSVHNPATPVPVAPAPAPAPAPPLVPPPALYERAVGMGVAKANQDWVKILAMGVMAGVMIGFGAFMAASIGASCPQLAATNPGLQKMVYGAFGLPFGLLLVLVCGAELFTGNTALVTAALHEGKVTVGQLAKSWGMSYIGNFIGSLLLVYAVFQCGLFAAGAAPASMAVAKTSLTFSQAFFRGILCNFLVCMGIWQASASNSLPGKAIGVWFPISAFVALGLEHSVANMFIIPMGIAIGAPVTWADLFLKNLIPVTLGNIVGGALCVGTAYAFFFGKLGKKAE